MRTSTTISMLAAGVLVLTAACAGDDLADDPSTGASSATTVSISGQDFDEMKLVASMYEQLLTAQGYQADVQLVGSRDVYMAKFPADIDIVPEYVGGIADFVNKAANGPEAAPITTNDAAETIEAAADLLAERGITLLAPSEATDANAFFVTRDFAEAEGITTLSDLEGRSVTLAAAPDCPGRADCEGGLTQVYGIDVVEVLPLGFASDQTYQSVLSGESELGLTSTTDGTLESQGLVMLQDDREIQTAQNLVPAVSTEFLDANPEVAEPLERLMSALTTEVLTELNGRIAVDREKPADVARDFLEDEDLL